LGGAGVSLDGAVLAGGRDSRGLQNTSIERAGFTSGGDRTGSLGSKPPHRVEHDITRLCYDQPASFGVPVVPGTDDIFMVGLLERPLDDVEGTFDRIGPNLDRASHDVSRAFDDLAHDRPPAIVPLDQDAIYSAGQC
jgi:hypothetical protein